MNTTPDYSNRGVGGMFGIGRTTFMKWLKEKKLINQYNTPCSYALSHGYMLRVPAKTYDTDVTRWTPAGVEWAKPTILSAIACGELVKKKIPKPRRPRYDGPDIPQIP